RALISFTRRLIDLRHALPMLRRSRFLTGLYNDQLGVKDVTWLTPAGEEMTPAHWQDPHARALGILLDGRAQPTGIRKRGTEVTLFLVLNAYHDVVRFTLPQVVGGSRWRCLVDTDRVDGTGSGVLAAGAQI